LLHSSLIKETGGIDGIRNINLLDSAINAPFQSFSESVAYPSIQQKAARLCFGLVTLDLAAPNIAARTPINNNYHKIPIQ